MADRVAVIADIHANLPALGAALARVDALGIETVYCGGDLVGYGPQPDAVCALIEARGMPTIYGNFDHAIARDRDDCGCAYITPEDRALGQRSVEWTLAHTGRAAKDFMRGLPFELRFRVGDRDVHLVHGSPRKVNEYLFEDKPASLYERLAAAETADALVFGHTHKPWARAHGGVLFVNCGSVGKPKDGDPRGAFAVLHADGAQLEVTIERAEYDAAAVAAELRAAGLPGCRGRSQTNSSPPADPKGVRGRLRPGIRSRVAGRFSRLTLRVDELAGYRAAVSACARPDERALSERLMGQLSSLEAGAIGAAPDAELAFRPAADAGELAVRGLKHLRTRPLRRRSRVPSR